MENQERYFIVFYQGATDQAPIFGSINVTKKNNAFFSKEDVDNYLTKIYEDQNPVTMSITNWIELNEKDFNDYIKTKVVKPGLPPPELTKWPRP